MDKKIYKLCFISDTHNQHKQVVIPKDIDFLIHSGDHSSLGKEHEIRNFNKWMRKIDLPRTHKICIAGNHDWGWYWERQWMKDICDGFTYLQDESYECEGIKFYGAPWQPEFYNWAFNLPRGGESLKRHWDAIPDDTDVLITHGPPAGILDLCMHGGRVGCELLLETIIMRVNPKIHAFGHIHFDYGFEKQGETIFVNACSVGEDYRYTNAPIVIELEI